MKDLIICYVFIVLFFNQCYQSDKTGLFNKFLYPMLRNLGSCARMRALKFRADLEEQLQHSIGNREMHEQERKSHNNNILSRMVVFISIVQVEMAIKYNVRILLLLIWKMMEIKL